MSMILELKLFFSSCDKDGDASTQSGLTEKTILNQKSARS